MWWNARRHLLTLVLAAAAAFAARSEPAAVNAASAAVAPRLITSRSDLAQEKTSPAPFTLVRQSRFSGASTA